MGEDIVPDINIVNRAKIEDLNRKVQYQVGEIRDIISMSIIQVFHAHPVRVEVSLVCAQSINPGG